MSQEQDSLELETPKNDSPLWEMSLVNLFAVILCIFVLLYSYSTQNQAKTVEAMHGVKGKFAKKNITQTEDISITSKTPVQIAASGSQEPLKLFYAELQKVAKDVLAIDQTNIIEEGNKLILRFPAILLFEEGQAKLDDKKLFMEALADQLVGSAIGHHMDVEYMGGSPVIDGKETKQAAVAVNRAGAFARRMVELGVRENSIYTGIGSADPDIITITFSPRDATRATLVF